ncbi:Auxin responsive SAUR protein [Corchorus olitorius]|uniref:Auxin responsive SAUR protein n=1 Tax=Corchorus olitorius TaxID=93759 RepID=A0A1R3JAY8_9ROSI|nr:Auxin responsive SAUR protein [Corchorus olitorius]
MISTKKLIKLARKWQKLAAIKRKRIASFSRNTRDAETNSCSTSPVVEKGHFVVYSADEKRFVLPLEYLKNEIVMELFNLAEEEFGLPSNGQLITLPCDAAFMEYLIGLIKKKASKEVEKALLMSLVNGYCSSSSSYLYQQETSQQLPIWSF